jgi:hypothetical protein
MDVWARLKYFKKIPIGLSNQGDNFSGALKAMNYFNA